MATRVSREGSGPRGTHASRVNSGNERRSPEEYEIVKAHIRRAYGWNYTDNEIALYADCSSKTVSRWREERELPSNYEGMRFG